MTLLTEQVNLAYTGIPTNCKSVKESKMMVSPNSALLFPVLTSLCSFFLDVAYSTVDTSETYIIKDCNSIQYRLMVDLGEPPFPDTACEIKQKTITCFEKSEGSGDLLDQDRFLLFKSATVDKVLMCPDLDYQKLQDSIQNSAAAQKLSKEYPTEIQQLPEKCAFDIHKNCEKKIFDQVVVNHLSWPETTKWRQCYLKALLQTPCSALILQNYAALQEKFGESFRKKEFDLGLYGIFMNDHHLQSNGTVEIL